jgi:4-amino-4-deoxy-L-arabinose transferase-like glycosyltransferase
MFERLVQRGWHYLLLVTVAGGLFLPNLGGPSLWDIDEGNNAEAAREMLEADNWRLPTFNYQMRVDKPALLYWLQIFGFRAFGVGEFAARLPSALASILTVLLTYELGRRMFGAGAGLLAGLVLASTIMFCAAAHFANPDALLTGCAVLAFFVFWLGIDGRLWHGSVGVCTGLAVLAKGPVGLLLPTTVIGLYLLQARQLRRLFEPGVLRGCLTFGLVALPWYIWVGVDTKFEFLRGFVGVHNVGRFLSPMEGHGGPAYYYLAAFALGFAPWSLFLIPVCWHAWKVRREEAAAQSPVRFLCCWIVCYLVFFSIARTKLPNYILPIYPAVALLTGRFLEDWRQGLAYPPSLCVRASLVGFALLGLGAAVGFAAAGGVIPLGRIPPQRLLPGVQAWAFLGIVPLAGALMAAWCARQKLRTGLIASFAVASGLFIGPLAVWGGSTLDAHKAPRSLAAAIAEHQVERDIRVACYGYSQPSLVFYCKREVSFLSEEQKALEFLRCPLEVYLIVPEQLWPGLADKDRGAHTVLARRHDLYRGCDVLLVTNR